MKVYLLRPGNGKTTRFCDPYIPQKNPWWNEELSVGIFEQAHALPIIYHVDNRNKPKEYMLKPHGLLFSGRLMQILKTMCENIQVFPAQMYLKGVERIFDEYYTIIFPHYEVLDIGKSVLTWSDVIPNFIFSVETVVVSKQKLEGVPHEDAIFHLKEQPTILLATEIAKTAIEAVTKDVAFIEVEVVE